jgi:hypothetical protein
MARPLCHPTDRLVASVGGASALCTWNLPFLSNDLYLYRLHGQMLTEQGRSPYAERPMECFSQEILENVPWTDQHSPYGPVALALFAAATSISDGSVLQFWLLKIVLAHRGFSCWRTCIPQGFPPCSTGNRGLSGFRSIGQSFSPPPDCRRHRAVCPSRSVDIGSLLSPFLAGSGDVWTIVPIAVWLTPLRRKLV